MIPLLGNPPPAAEAKFRAALRLVGEALIDWAGEQEAPAPLATARTAVPPPEEPAAGPIPETDPEDDDLAPQALQPAAEQAPEQAAAAEEAAIPLAPAVSATLVSAVSEQKLPRPRNELLVWTPDHDSKLRELAGTMPAHEAARLLGVSLSTLYKHAGRLKLGFGIKRPAATSVAAPTAPTVPVEEATAAGDDAGGTVPVVDMIAAAREVSAPVGDARVRADADEPDRRTFAIPEGHVAVRDDSGRATGDTVALADTVQDEAARQEPEVPSALAKPLPKSSRKALPAVPATPSTAVRPSGDRPIQNRRAPSIAPTNSQWVRLRHPDGRWLSTDCLHWVENRKDSYLAQAKYLIAVRAKFPLARECVEVTEAPWRPRDVEYRGMLK